MDRADLAPPHRIHGRDELTAMGISILEPPLSRSILLCDRVRYVIAAAQSEEERSAGLMT
jgi:hypothetical protein